MKQNNFARLFSVLICAAMLLTLCACGNPAETIANSIADSISQGIEDGSITVTTTTTTEKDGVKTETVETNTAAGEAAEPDADFVGLWQYDNYDITITLEADGTFLFTTTNSQFDVTGTWALIGDDTVECYDADDSLYTTLTLSGSTLTDNEGDTLSRVKSDDTAEAAAPAKDDTAVQTLGGLDDFVGVWEYDDFFIWIEIFPDGSWDYYDYNGYGGSGSSEGPDDSDTLFLYFDGEEITELTDNGDGTLYDIDGDTLSPSSIPDDFDSIVNDESDESDESGDSADDYAGEFAGVWEYDDYSDMYLIAPSGYVAAYADGVIEGLGYIYDNDGTTLTIAFCDDSAEEYAYVELTMNDDGTVTDQDGDTMYYSMLDDFESTSADGIEGVWEYDDYYIWYHLSDSMWVEYDEDEYIYTCGYYTDNGDGTVTLYTLLNLSEYAVISYDAASDTMSDDGGDTMFRSTNYLF